MVKPSQQPNQAIKRSQPVMKREDAFEKLITRRADLFDSNRTKTAQQESNVLPSQTASQRASPNMSPSKSLTSPCGASEARFDRTSPSQRMNGSPRQRVHRPPQQTRGRAMNNKQLPRKRLVQTYVPHVVANNVVRNVNPQKENVLPAVAMLAGRNDRGWDAEYKIRVYDRLGLSNWETSELRNIFEQHGTVISVELIQSNHALAYITFQPPPSDLRWVSKGLIGNTATGVPYKLDLDPLTRFNATQIDKAQAWMLFEAISFGVLQDQATMLAYRSLPTQTGLSVERFKRTITIEFTLPDDIVLPAQDEMSHTYRLDISMATIENIIVTTNDAEAVNIILTVSHPPQLFRKLKALDFVRRDERSCWYRQTSVPFVTYDSRKHTTWSKADCIFDVGRHLTYQLTIQKNAQTSTHIENLRQALPTGIVKMVADNCFHIVEAKEEASSKWLDGGIRTTGDPSAGGASLSLMINQMHMDLIHLPFEVRYHLEVCLSLGVLHDSNITRDFLVKLRDVSENKAIKLLTKAADGKKRYYKPDDIFRLRSQISFAARKTPEYCTKILAATVTPTTMYLHPPVLETSNRIVRKYKQYEDRFLRVKFSDELYRGKIMSRYDDLWLEVFARIKHTMDYGIKIGDRVYEFLAFGNSQFREHGAYFFASNAVLDAATIRRNMGTFDHIRIIAKYASRLGQCFSTTRAVPWPTEIRDIPDVHRNGHCFTDGVGMISPFLARMIVNHYKLPAPPKDYSVFQFRLQGLKGVLAVNPKLNGSVICKRPSQEKFTAPMHGLEICRISQFCAANLNVQIILVLSALGVKDEVFVNKLTALLEDLREAMINEEKAADMLQKYVDYNQNTLIMAQMVVDGFMTSQEPYFISCLRLWRSWSTKYLKEKARIFIEKGAFVLGCTDETGTLKGHHERGTASARDYSSLPELFIQVSDPEARGTERYKVIEGICALARNPSLHPGDIRVVRAVDVPELRHLKNCVVLPQNGDRDLANMCSGGDLDGDDYLVLWDPDLLPQEWNHCAMNYTPPAPVVSDTPVTVDQMTTFFVDHIKNDNLGTIAVAHRYWADQLEGGIKNKKCLQLAALHSRAVDYAKTGVPADFPVELRIDRWPHWANVRNKPKCKIYHSDKIIGQLYDVVEAQPFAPAWDLPFDSRILDACDPTEEQLSDAIEIKKMYDEAVCRVMARYGLKTEFEACTAFALEHNPDINDYQFAERLGETMASIRQQHEEMCYEKAGVDPLRKDWSKLRPFIVAMYRVTAEEVEQFKEKSTQETALPGDSPLPPFISFPWIFHRELGRIARETQSESIHGAVEIRPIQVTKRMPKKKELAKDNIELPKLRELTFEMETEELEAGARPITEFFESARQTGLELGGNSSELQTEDISGTVEQQAAVGSLLDVLPASQVGEIESSPRPDSVPQPDTSNVVIESSVGVTEIGVDTVKSDEPIELSRAAQIDQAGRGDATVTAIGFDNTLDAGRVSSRHEESLAVKDSCPDSSTTERVVVEAKGESIVADITSMAESAPEREHNDFPAASSLLTEHQGHNVFPNHSPRSPDVCDSLETHANPAEKADSDDNWAATSFEDDEEVLNRPNRAPKRFLFDRLHFLAQYVGEDQNV